MFELFSCFLQEDIRDYDMEFVNMRSKGLRFLSLEVPGLAERRPSLVCGDYIFAKLSSRYPNEATAYQVCATCSNSKAC